MEKSSIKDRVTVDLVLAQVRKHDFAVLWLPAGVLNPRWSMKGVGAEEGAS
jgi:hypothetical protein